MTSLLHSTSPKLQRGNDPDGGRLPQPSCGFFDARAYYPRVSKLLLDHSGAIHAELLSLLEGGADGRRWGVWAAEDYEPPKFTLLTPEQILERQETVVKDPENPSQWSLYGIFLFGNTIERGKRACPETHKVLKQIPGIVNAGFSCLGPWSETKWHDDVDRGFDRLHLPLIVPEGDVGFKVGQDTKKWRLGHVLAFDDTFRHNAWNATEEARFVLIVDVQRSPSRSKVVMNRLAAIADGDRQSLGAERFCKDEKVQLCEEDEKKREEGRGGGEKEQDDDDDDEDLLDKNFYDDWETVIPALQYVMSHVSVLKREWSAILDFGRGAHDGSADAGEAGAGCGDMSLLIDSPELTYDRQRHTWKNYWLCHSFPAQTDEFTTWIENNCVRMPKTATLLKSIPGIRDAFFSRLGPGVVLEEHNGYADQSNYVLRCHVPLIVPEDIPVPGADGGETGLVRSPCYVECNGERRHHVLGEPIVFDDSKLHSAGNLSPNQSRTVLILDFARPKTVRTGCSISRISRSMMSDWCRQVYPGISDLKVQSIVDSRASSCDFFDEFDEFDDETTFTA